MIYCLLIVRNISAYCCLKKKNIYIHSKQFHFYFCKIGTSKFPKIRAIKDIFNLIPACVKRKGTYATTIWRWSIIVMSSVLMWLCLVCCVVSKSTQAWILPSPWHVHWLVMIISPARLPLVLSNWGTYSY